MWKLIGWLCVMGAGIAAVLLALGLLFLVI
jgi:hypothetical protein